MLELLAILCVAVCTLDAGARLARLFSLKHADAMTRTAAVAIAEGTDEEAAAALEQLTRLQVTAAELRRLELFALEHGDPLVSLPLYRALSELKARRGVDVGVDLLERAHELEQRQAVELDAAIKRAAEDAIIAERARAIHIGEELAIDIGVMP